MFKSLLRKLPVLFCDRCLVYDHIVLRNDSFLLQSGDLIIVNMLNIWRRTFL